MAGQFRAGGFGVIGWDFSAAFALAQALGVSAFLVAEMLPDIESVTLRALRDNSDGDGDG